MASARGNRRSRRIGGPAVVAAVSLLVAISGLLPAGVAGAAGAPQVELSLQVGYGGALPPWGWTPVNLTVRTGAVSFRGSLVVWTDQPPSSLQLGAGIPSGSRVGQSLAQNPEPSVAARRDLTVAPGGTARVTVELLDHHQTVSAEVLTESGRPVASAQAPPPIPLDGPQVAVVSDNPTSLDGFAQVSLPGPGVHIQVLHLTTADLPESGVALRAFSLVAFDRASTATLSAGQRSALSDYVASGGDLLVVGGSGWQGTVAGLPSRLVGLAPSGVQTLPGLPGLASELGVATLASPVEVSAGAPGGGVAALSEGTTPILVQASDGVGQTFFLTIDPSVEPVASWPGQAGLLREVLVRALLSGSVRPGWALAPNPGFTANGSWLFQALANLPSLHLPSLWLIGVIVATYILVCGPGVRWVLRRRGRPDLAWVAIPLVAAVSAGAIIAGTLGLRGSEAVTDRIRVIRLVPGSPDALVETAVGVFGPRLGTGMVEEASQACQASTGRLVAALARLGGAGPVPATPVIEPPPVSGGTRVALSWDQPGALQAFGEEAFQPAPGTLEQHLTLSGNHIAGTITSHLPVTLTGAVAIAGAVVQPLGTITSGATISVNLSTADASTGSAAGGLAAQATLASGKAAASALAGREAAQRQSVLEEVLGNNVDSSPPTLVGWFRNAGPPLRVDGKLAHPEDLTALVVALDAAVGGPTLAPGDVPAHVVGLGGSVSPNVALSGARTFGNLGPGATVTYEFSLPPGVGRDRLALSLQAASGSSLAAGGLALEVFDHATLHWDSLDQAPTAAGQPVALPAAGSVSGDGLVRVRVRNTSNAPATFGGIELSSA
jgi:hypothetical protein